MGDTAKRFSALLTVICRTAKRSANKMARIRKKRNGGSEEIHKSASRSGEAVIGSSCKVRSSNKTTMTQDEKGSNLIEYLIKTSVSKVENFELNRYLQIERNWRVFVRRIEDKMIIK